MKLHIIDEAERCLKCKKPLCQRNMTAMQNCSGCHTDLLVAMTTFIFSIREQPTVHSFAGWAYKAVWPALFRKIFVAGFSLLNLAMNAAKVSLFLSGIM